MDSLILLCLYLCVIFSLAWSEEPTETPSSEGTTTLPHNPNEDASDDSAKKIITRVSIVVSEGLYSCHFIIFFSVIFSLHNRGLVFHVEV